MSPFPTRPTMPPAVAMQAFSATLQAMQGIAALGRFGTAYDDVAQQMAALMQVFLAPLSDIYVALNNAAMDDDQEGGAV